MVDWLLSKIAVSIKIDAEDIDEPLKLPNNVTITTSRDYDKVQGFSDGEFNAGYIAKPPTYAITISVPAVSSSARLLRAAMAAKSTCEIITKDSLGDAGEYALLEETLSGVHITSQDAAYTVGDLAMLRYNGIALGYTFRSRNKDGTTIDIGAVKPSNGSIGNYGDGISEAETKLGLKNTSLFNEWW